MAYSRGQWLSLALAPKFSGFLALCGSLWIVLKVLCSTRKHNETYHRIMLGMASVDVLTSLFFFASTWPIPSDHGAAIVWAAGNATTCRLQAWCIQFGSASFMYNAILTLYFVLVVRYSLEESALRRWEWLFHAVPLLWGFVTATVGLVRGLFGNATLWCWIGGTEDAYIYRWAFYYAPLWLCFLIVLVGMCLIYGGVRRKERKTSKLDSVVIYQRRATQSVENMVVSQGMGTSDHSRGVRPTRQSRSRRVAIQAMWYVAVFYITYCPATINRVYQQIHDGASLYVLLLLHVFFAPLQGYWNFFIYRRQHIAKLKRDNPQWSWFRAIYKSLEITAITKLGSRRSISDVSETDEVDEGDGLSLSIRQDQELDHKLQPFSAGVESVSFGEDNYDDTNGMGE